MWFPFLFVLWIIISFACLWSNTKTLNNKSFEIKANFNQNNSIFSKQLQVEYFQFEYYCAFVNSINTKTTSSIFVRPIQRVSHVHPTNFSALKSFPKRLIPKSVIFFIFFPNTHYKGRTKQRCKHPILLYPNRLLTRIC